MTNDKEWNNIYDSGCGPTCIGIMISSIIPEIDVVRMVNEFSLKDSKKDNLIKEDLNFRRIKQSTKGWIWMPLPDKKITYSLQNILIINKDNEFKRINLEIEKEATTRISRSKNITGPFAFKEICKALKETLVNTPKTSSFLIIGPNYHALLLAGYKCENFKNFKKKLNRVIENEKDRKLEPMDLVLWDPDLGGYAESEKVRKYEALNKMLIEGEYTLKKMAD